MTEYLPILIFAGAALLVFAVIRQVQGAVKETSSSNEPFKYSMPMETTKTELDQILAAAIMSNGVERRWLPAEVVESRDGFLSIRYKIYYEFETVRDSDLGTMDKHLTSIFLNVKLQELDNDTSLAEFSLKDETKYLLGPAPEAAFLKSTTLLRITQGLAKSSIQQQVAEQQGAELGTNLPVSTPVNQEADHI